MNGLILDARWLETGIGTYTANLTRALYEAGLRFSVITQTRYAESLSKVSDDVRTVDARMYSLREQLEVLWSARNDSLLHVLHYNAPVVRTRPTLATIHDLTHILDQTHRSTLKSRVYARPMLSRVARRAAHLFTVSEYSRRQIVEHLGVSPSDITVTYNGVSAEFYPEPRESARQHMLAAHGVGSRYILYVGNLKPHKNVTGLLDAFALLCKEFQVTHKLLVIGFGEAARVKLMERAQRLGVASDVAFKSNFSAKDLRMAYSGADVTVLPSFEEGFGLPVVESMACGTPVACSNVAALTEVGGEAATYFDPTDVESMTSAILALIESADVWCLRRVLGFENARRFTWKSCAARHLEIYRRFAPAACFDN